MKHDDPGRAHSVHRLYYLFASAVRLISILLVLHTPQYIDCKPPGNPTWMHMFDFTFLTAEWCLCKTKGHRTQVSWFSADLHPYFNTIF